MFIMGLDDTKVKSRENVTEGWSETNSSLDAGIREDSEKLSLGNVKFENAYETSKCTYQPGN